MASHRGTGSVDDAAEKSGWVRVGRNEPAKCRHDLEVPQVDRGDEAGESIRWAEDISICESDDCVIVVEPLHRSELVVHLLPAVA